MRRKVGHVKEFHQAASGKRRPAEAAASQWQAAGRSRKNRIGSIRFIFINLINWQGGVHIQSPAFHMQKLQDQGTRCRARGKVGKCAPLEILQIYYRCTFKQKR